MGGHIGQVQAVHRGRLLCRVGQGRQREHGQPETGPVNHENGADVTTWSDLPEPVREAVDAHVGPVTRAVDIHDGQNSDLAVLLHRTGRPVFLKGVEGVSLRMRWLRNEITAGTLAADVSPAVVFHADVDDWLVVGFEYVFGRPASLAPGSSDLPTVAATVERISALPAPDLRPMRNRWASLVPALVDGDRLLHTDLHGDQFLIDDQGEARVVDWGGPLPEQFGSMPRFS